jgi:hypothetical protein
MLKRYNVMNGVQKYSMQYMGDQIKEDEMSSTCSTQGKDEKYIHINWKI